MVPLYRRPPYEETYSGIALSQAPRPVRALLATSMTSALKGLQGHDLIQEEYRAKTKIIRVPAREDFERYFMRKAAHPPVLLVDRKSERLWLTGIGQPGRSEIEQEHIPIKDKYGVVERYEVKDKHVRKDDRIVVFTEVSFADEHEAYRMAERLPLWAHAGLRSFYALPQHHPVPHLLLALPGLSDERATQLAHYELQQQARRQ